MAELSNLFVDGRRGARATGVVFLGLGAFLLISLATSSSGDYPNASRPLEATVNWGGRVGAQIAYGAFSAVGYPAYALPVLCLLWGVAQLRGAPILRTVGASLGVASIAGLLSVGSGLPLQHSAYAGHQMGGWLGQEAASSVLIPYIGRAGASVVIGALLAAAVILTTGLTLGPLGHAAVAAARGLAHLIWAVLGLPGALVRLGARLFVPRRRVAAGELAATSGGGGDDDESGPPAWTRAAEEAEPPAGAAPVEVRVQTSPPAVVLPPPSTPGHTGGPASETLPHAVRSEPDGTEGSDAGLSEGHGPREAVAKPAARPDGAVQGAPSVPAWTAATAPADDPAPSPPPARTGKTTGSRYQPLRTRLLDEVPPGQGRIDNDALQGHARLLEKALANFDVGGKVVHVSPGPVVTRYEVEPADGVKVSRIVTLADDLARVMSANGIRIQAPVPGRSVVGVEIANQHRETVYLREVLESKAFRQAESRLTMALGKTISGEPFVADLTRMPHLLVAGATGSGKSVCINSIICSILFKSTPEEVRFLLVDPKVVELTTYNGIPHLLTPVVTEPKKAAEALKWAVAEMEVRYQKLAKLAVRNLADYNRRVARLAAEPDEDGVVPPTTLPHVVIVIDEFADLMLTAPAEVESLVMSLAQKSRAVGIHIVLATQRPSVNVITGVIKANFPSRIAFQVATKTDSRTIIDMNGAERLLGRGDMLFLPGGQGDAIRVHGAYVSGEEIERLVGDFRDSKYQAEQIAVFDGRADISAARGDQDELFDEAVRIVMETQQASTSFLQRRMKVGYSRAARLMDEMERAGIVGPAEGAKPRQILIAEDTLDTDGAA